MDNPLGSKRLLTNTYYTTNLNAIPQQDGIR
jgi:hypothetical protein